MRLQDLAPEAGGVFEQFGVCRAQFGGGGRDGLAEQFADELAERLVRRAVAAVVDVVLQVVHQLVRRGVTLGQVARQAAVQNVVERVVNPVVERAEIRDGLVHDPLAGFLGGRAFENVVARAAGCASTTPAEKRSERLSVILKIRLLRAHVIRLAGDDFALLVGQKAARLGDAEVGQLHVALEGDHDVLEAHVAMDDAQRLAVLVGLGMGVGQSAGDAAGDEHRQFRAATAGACRRSCWANCSRFTPRISSMAMK